MARRPRRCSAHTGAHTSHARWQGKFLAVSVACEKAQPAGFVPPRCRNLVSVRTSLAPPEHRWAPRSSGTGDVSGSRYAPACWCSSGRRGRGCRRCAPILRLPVSLTVPGARNPTWLISGQSVWSGWGSERDLAGAPTLIDEQHARARGDHEFFGEKHAAGIDGHRRPGRGWTSGVVGFSRRRTAACRTPVRPGRTGDFPVRSQARGPCEALCLTAALCRPRGAGCEARMPAVCAGRLDRTPTSTALFDGQE